MDTKQMIQNIQDKIGIWELIQSNDYNIVRDPNINIIKYNCTICNEESKPWHKCERMFYKKISLSRVLSALGNQYWYVNWDIIYDYSDWYWNISYETKRKLTNEDNSDAMIDDQSPETIKAIYDILLPTK